MNKHSDHDHGSIKSYLLGFLFCIALTVCAFLIIGKKLLTGEAAFITIIALALAQFFVQLKYFLHLSMKSKARWNLIVFVFTCIILLILVLGSLWIMRSLNYNMMSH